ncbi:carbohydrate ABC transporter permease [Demequina pelophila]|uniref:carbohydrate ABC transporter permease n=1 Tax=Demequina pelophila TaxID=1638984 RepID=UPI000784ACBB|nr:carbohydrate ABC transporter permease [Demequina pelophila]
MATLTTPAPEAQVKDVRRRRRPSLGKIAGWAVLISLIVVTIFPFYWMLRTALSTNAALFTDTSSLGPVGFSWEGFRRALGLATVEESLADGGSGASLNLVQNLINSVIVATTVTVVQTLASAMAAYAFTRLQWRGRDTLFKIFIVGLMVPLIFTLIPNFVLMRELGLIDTLAGIALPTLFISPFAVFFLRQFFMGISVEIEEAAQIDGAGRLRRMFQVILPQAAPALITLAIITYIAAWNDYLWPLMVSNSESSRVLTVALGVFRSQATDGTMDWAGLMAATLIAALPMLLLFLVFAKRIVNNIGFNGIK